MSRGFSPEPEYYVWNHIALGGAPQLFLPAPKITPRSACLDPPPPPILGLPPVPSPTEFIAPELTTEPSSPPTLVFDPKAPPACRGFPQPDLEGRRDWITLQPVQVRGEWPKPFQIRREDWHGVLDEVCKGLKKDVMRRGVACRNTQCDKTSGDGLYVTRWTPIPRRPDRVSLLELPFVELACFRCHSHWEIYGLAWPDLHKTESSDSEIEEVNKMV